MGNRLHALYRLWRWFLAYTRLSMRVVCEESKDLGPVDYHDYPDDEDGQPWHMCWLTCKRCGKKFII